LNDLQGRLSLLSWMLAVW